MRPNRAGALQTKLIEIIRELEAVALARSPEDEIGQDRCRTQAIAWIRG